MIFRYRQNDTTCEIKIELLADGRYTAIIGEREYVFFAEKLRDGGWRLILDDANVVAYTASAGEKRYIHVDGKYYELSVADARHRRRVDSVRGGDLTAQMPGQVVDVLVSDGDEVRQGQTLMVLEAMKMEIRIIAPADGVVRRLLVKKGELVERGQQLAQM